MILPLLITLMSTVQGVNGNDGPDDDPYQSEDEEENGENEEEMIRRMLRDAEGRLDVLENELADQRRARRPVPEQIPQGFPIGDPTAIRATLSELRERGNTYRRLHELTGASETGVSAYVRFGRCGEKVMEKLNYFFIIYFKPLHFLQKGTLFISSTGGTKTLSLKNWGVSTQVFQLLNTGSRLKIAPRQGFLAPGEVKNIVVTLKPGTPGTHTLKVSSGTAPPGHPRVVDALAHVEDAEELRVLVTGTE